MHSAVLPQYSICLSVSVCLFVCLCLSVTHFRYWYRAHIGWNSSKIISRPNSLRLCAGWLQHGRSGATGTPQNYGRIEVGSGAHKSCHTSEMAQDRDGGYYYGLIGSRIRAFDWHQNQSPRMTLNGRNVTLAEINNISPSLNSFRIKIRAKYKLVAVSVNKIRVNSLYIERIARSSLRQHGSCLVS